MDKAIEALKSLLEELSYEYEKALQTEEEAQVAYKEGLIKGVQKSINVLENFI